jgi:hypothetical protein
VAMTATAITGTQAALQGTQAVLQGTQGALNSTAAALTATAAVGAQTATPTPLVAQSTVPVVNIGCLGDEQLWFTPRKPNVGTHVDISVTSQRHHDARVIRLTGPLDPGPVTERIGPLGFLWTWTVIPSVEDFHQWTFYADGLRPCITSGFNAYVALGSTATPTLTPIATNTPGTATATPTSTPVPVPVLQSVSPADTLTCGGLATIKGRNFGTPPSAVGTGVNLSINSTGHTANFPTLQQQGTGSDQQLRVIMPSTSILNSQGGLTGPISGTITVSNNGGDSVASVNVTFTSGCQ